MEESDLMHEGGQVLHVPVGVEEGGEQTGAQVVQVATRSRGGAASPAGPSKGDRRAPREKVFSPSLPARAERALVVGVGGPRVVVSPCCRGGPEPFVAGGPEGPRTASTPTRPPGPTAQSSPHTTRARPAPPPAWSRRTWPGRRSRSTCVGPRGGPPSCAISPSPGGHRPAHGECGGLPCSSWPPEAPAIPCPCQTPNASCGTCQPARPKTRRGDPGPRPPRKERGPPCGLGADPAATARTAQPTAR